MMSCVAWQAVTCFGKYSQNLLGTSIHYSRFDSAEKPALTFCSTKQIFLPAFLSEANKILNSDMNSYMHYTNFKSSFNKSHDLFWNQETSLEHMIERIQVSSDFGTSPWHLLWSDRNSTGFPDIIFNRLYVPTENMSLQFCHSLDLNKIEPFTAIKFFVKTDVVFALHKVGMFSQRQFTSTKSALSPENLQEYSMGQELKHQDSLFSVKLTNKYFEEASTSCKKDSLSFDTCAHSRARRVSEKKANCALPFAHADRNQYPLCRNGTSEELALTMYANAYLDQNKLRNFCPFPCETIIADLAVTSRRASEKIKRGQKRHLAEIQLVMPRMVKILQSFPAYTFVNLVAEFGGWVCLFLGVCLLDLHKCCFRQIAKIFSHQAYLSLVKSAEQIVGKVLSVFFTACVLWQIYICAERYLSRPVATKIYYGKLSLLQPKITLCQVRKNREFLHNYYEKKLEKGNISLALQVDEMIDSVRLSSSEYSELKFGTEIAANASEDPFIVPKYSQEAAYVCRTINIDFSWTDTVQLHFRIKKNVYVSIHEGGQFFEDSFSSTIKLSRKSAEDNVYNVEMAHSKFLNTDRFPCNPEPTEYDGCLQNVGRQAMMDSVGCLAPVFPHSDRSGICANESLAHDAVGAYHKFMTSDLERQSKYCLMPCQITDVTVREDKTSGSGNSQTVYTFNLPTRVKIIESFYFYRFLSLVAEVGGWVGLFLGIYIMQINDVLNYLFMNYA